MTPGGSQRSSRSKRSSTRSASSVTGPTKGTACDQDAFDVLKKAGYAVKKVYRVEPDRLLWVDRLDRAKTALIQAREKDGAWLCRVVTTYDGWPL